jgi:FPC/CPF motif-containing protein YcgG
MWDISKNETSLQLAFGFTICPTSFFPIGYHPRKKRKKEKKKIFKVTEVPFQVGHKLNYFLICRIF